MISRKEGGGLERGQKEGRSSIIEVVARKGVTYHLNL